MFGVRRLWPVVVLTVLLAGIAQAQLVNLGPGSFTPAAPVITFGEVPYHTQNPVYTFTGLAGLGDVTVSFGPAFVGQSVVGGGVKTLSGTPTGPLALDGGLAALYPTFTQNDGASDSNPVLSGSPIFNGPISVLFSTPVAGVGLKGGYFDALHATSITAFDANGIVLGTITNSVTGFEFYGLADASGKNVISGISFYITGNEPAGFAIDNLTFGAKEQIRPPVPEPVSLILLGSGAVGLIGRLRRRKA